MKDCLEEHREDPEFSPDCKAEFESMMQDRAADFRLDSSLRDACASDIEETCGYAKVRQRLRHSLGRRHACVSLAGAQGHRPSSCGCGLACSGRLSSGQ